MLAIDPEFKRIEARGSLTQLSTKIWKQVNVLEVKKSSRFGGHYHKMKKELFYVARGSVIVKITGMSEKNPDLRENFCFAFYQGDMFIVEPFESHSIFGLEDSIIVVLLSGKHSRKDTYNEA